MSTVEALGNPGYSGAHKGVAMRAHSPERLEYEASATDRLDSDGRLILGVTVVVVLTVMATHLLA